MDFREFFRREPRTQASLFNYVLEKPPKSAWAELDFSFLRHPIQFFKEEWNAPRTRASLFHYIDDASEASATPYTWKNLCQDILGSFRNPGFIPSLLDDANDLVMDRGELRSRRLRASGISILLHFALFAIVLFSVFIESQAIPPPKDAVVFVNQPFLSPFESTGPNGGGGGGGGKQEKTPPSIGRMPDTTRFQLVAPDPSDPVPLIPAEDLNALSASVQMPIDIPQDQSMAIGDVTAPPSALRSSGGGSGGGIGTGRGTGVGSGYGPGVGPGSGGGMGGGSGGGIGSGIGPYVVGGGVRPPEVIVQPLPPYTEEARKSRVEGVVTLQAIVRKDGTVDSFKVVRGLGYGLDESAINTIANKWKFRPGSFNGQAVDVIANIEISFRLY